MEFSYLSFLPLQARKQEKQPNKTTLVLTFDPLLELGWLPTLIFLL
jgi:hypothetical protein